MQSASQEIMLLLKGSFNYHNFYIPSKYATFMGILSFFSGGNTLYYPGCLSKYVLKAETENYKKILEKLGVDFIMLPDELCCGSPVRNAGYEAEARKLARKNFDIFKKHGVKKIITNCPACFKSLKEYKELISDWNIEVEHIIFTILKSLKAKHIKNMQTGRIAYHDPCHLGRHSNIYEEPRNLLKLIGLEVVEMLHTKENALCCGAGAGLRVNNPSLAGKMMLNRIKEAKEVGAEKIITTCPLCFSHLSNLEIPVEEFSYVLAEALGLKAEKTDGKDFKGEACS